ncbi:hypothetical protein DID88_009306 [Monilinia fructigena]|uniref:Uncharacterized protein n=1 Tax=Monilinia fructigena TaxID=38457 RepID=A0A395IFB5_9HELO|nr:hypothetical protein DID88_009306 [Monilinia fructigena]
MRLKRLEGNSTNRSTRNSAGNEKTPAESNATVDATISSSHRRKKTTYTSEDVTAGDSVSRPPLSRSATTWITTEAKPILRRNSMSVDKPKGPPSVANTVTSSTSQRRGSFLGSWFSSGPPPPPPAPPEPEKLLDHMEVPQPVPVQDAPERNAAPPARGARDRRERQPPANYNDEINQRRRQEREDERLARQLQNWVLMPFMRQLLRASATPSRVSSSASKPKKEKEKKTKSSILAGLGSGQNRVDAWRSFVTPGAPSAEPIF